MNAQKLKLKDFKITEYEILANDKVEISTHAVIDKKGNLIVYSDSWDGKNFFQYKLDSEEIENLNMLAEKDMEYYVKQKKLNKNEYFAGQRRFITFKYKGKTKSLCYIEPFMTDEFKKLIKPLNKKIYKHDSEAKTTMQSTDFTKTELEIIEREKIDNYLPQKAIIRAN